MQQRFKTAEKFGTTIDTDTRRYTGFLVHWNEIKCYGFVRPSDPDLLEGDAFFGAGAVTESSLNPDDLRRGDKVEFSLRPSDQRVRPLVS